MKSRQNLLFLLLMLSITLTNLTGCNSIGMLLFYRDSKTVTVFRSSDSKQDYYIIKATTLSHCGCTELYIHNYKNGKTEFNIFYNENLARKTIFQYRKETNKIDTIRLMASPNSNYTIAFNPLDIAIFNRIDTIIVQKPKGIVYPIQRTQYKGYISDPYYNQ